MRELSSIEKKWLEERLLNLKNYNKEIKQRRFELNFDQIKEVPTVIQFTKGSDEYIEDRLRWKRGFTSMYQNSNDDIKDLIHYKFILHPYYSWEEVANYLNYTTGKVYRMRDHILESFAEAINYI